MPAVSILGGFQAPVDRLAPVSQPPTPEQEVGLETSRGAPKKPGVLWPRQWVQPAGRLGKAHEMLQVEVKQ